LIDQRALTRSGGPGQADDTRVAAMREQSLQQIGRPRQAIFDRADGTRQRKCIAGTQALNPGL
jgi:hypothetical protein